MKPIPDFPNYFADEAGNIYSMFPVNQHSKPPEIPKQLKPCKTWNGYLMVILCKGGKTFNKLVHRLVLEAFEGKSPKGMQCCHNDGVKANCAIDNLRWDTRSNNEADKKKHKKKALEE